MPIEINFSQGGVRPLIQEIHMLFYSVIFLFVALVAGLLGFSGIGVEMAKSVFFVFAAMGIGMLLVALIRTSDCDWGRDRDSV